MPWKVEQYQTNLNLSFNKGFTLIELVITILIISIVMAIGVPKFFGFKQFSARVSSDELLFFLKSSKLRALRSGCDIKVDLANNQLYLYGRNDCTSGDFNLPLLAGDNKPVVWQTAKSSGLIIEANNLPFVITSAGVFHNEKNEVVNSRLKIDNDSFSLNGEIGSISVTHDDK